MFSKEKKIIVGIIGNVDSGKTTLTENLKNISIKVKEPGGITQKIGLYSFEMKGNKIAIIDNPGHKIFEENLNLSFKIADIIILMISGTDKYNLYTKKILEKKDKRFFFIINKVDDGNYDKNNIKKILLRYEIDIKNKNVFFTSVKDANNVKDIFGNIIDSYHINNIKRKKIEGFFVTNSYFEKKMGIITCGISLNEKVKTNLFVIKKHRIIGKVRKIFSNKKNVIQIEEKEPCVIFGIKEAIKTGERIRFTEKRITSSEKKTIKKKNFKKYKKKIKVIIVSNDRNILDAAVKIIEKKKKIIILKKRVGQILKDDIFMLNNFNDIRLITFLEKGYLHERSSNFQTIYELKRSLKKKKKEKDQEVSGIIKIMKVFKKKNKIIYGCMLLEGKIKKNSKILHNGEKIGIKELKINKTTKENIESIKQLFGLLLSKNKIKFLVNEELKVL
ncbi:Translation initiation factor 2 [Candidatus Vidania fulgoroideae]|nr:Translation initiation factor 2 [Candidatus Vidania fulgoroideae]